MTQLTVAVCTYRRAELLPVTLESLAQAQPPDGSWELLIVDNDGDPAVRAITQRFANRLPVRYVAEPRVGIARARNCAIESAAAPVVLFADDDVVFDPQWLAAMARAIHEHPECDFWGGRIVPQWNMPQPDWFDLRRCPMLNDTIVRYDAGEQSRAWERGRDLPFYTCNLSLRVEAVRRAGLFNVGMGHVGAARGGGEDTWMIHCIARNGGKGWYAADAVLYHPVPAPRITRAYARDFAWRQGELSVEMLRLEQPATPRWLYPLALRQMARGMKQWLGGALHADPAEAFAGQYRLLFNFSKLYHALAWGQVKR